MGTSVSHDHPLNDPSFDSKSTVPVWYLSHPLAPDEHYTFEQNMAHVIKVSRICIESGLRVIAPYHSLCLALDETNPHHRRIGLEIDLSVVRALRRVIAVGHKISSGMRAELDEAHQQILLVNVPDRELPSHIVKHLLSRAT